MAIPVRNALVQDLLNYLEERSETDAEADNLYHELLQEQLESEREELKVEGTLPEPKSGAWIV